MDKQEEKMWAIVKIVLSIVLFVGLFVLLEEIGGVLGIIVIIGMIGLIGQGIFFGKW